MDEVKQIVDYARTFFLKTGSHPPIVFLKGTGGKVALEFKTFGATAGERELDMLNAGTMVGHHPDSCVETNRRQASKDANPMASCPH